MYKKRGKSRKKIMVMDDDTDIILSIKEGLEYLSNRYEIIGVSSGLECFEALKKGDIPDLILLDIMMPEMDGWQVYKILKESRDWSSTPIIFVTALKDEKTYERGLKTDVYCIRKPIEMRELKERIDEVLEED